MMRNLIYILFTPLLMSWVSGQVESFRFNSRKGIKSEIRREFDFKQKFGEWKEIPGKEKIHYYYDNNGQVLEESKYDFEGELITKITYKYNENKKRIEQRDYKPDGSLKYRINFKYDANGNMIEESKYDSDDWKLYTKKNYAFSKYNSDGYIVEETKYDSDMLLKSKITYKYDSYGNLTESSKFGLMKSKITNKFDLYGNMIAELKYDSGGTLTNQSVSEYDSIGNHIAWSLYDPEGNLSSFNEGNVSLKDYSKWVRKYDTNGNQVEALFYDDEENLSQRYVYQYGDDQNYEYMVYAYEYKFGELQEIPVKKVTFEYEEY